MPPVLWKNAGKDNPSPEEEQVEHVLGAVSRVKGRVKAAFARFREHSRRPSRTPNRATHHNQVATSDDVLSPSTSTRAQLRPPFSTTRNIHFQSILAGSSGVPPFCSALPSGPLPDRVPALTLPTSLERQPPPTMEGEQSAEPLNPEQFICRNAAAATGRCVGDQTAVRSTPEQLEQALVAPPLLRDTKLSPSRTPKPLAQLHSPAQKERLIEKSAPKNKNRIATDLPDDTGDRSEFVIRNEVNLKNEDKASSKSSSSESENAREQESVKLEAFTRCSNRSDSVEPYEACQSTKTLQDSQSVPNFCGSCAPTLSAVDAEAYKSVLWEIKKQNDAFQESWKRLEERLDRLENVLCDVYKRGEPAIKCEEVMLLLQRTWILLARLQCTHTAMLRHIVPKKEEWDFSRGFVVNEAESLDLIVDLSNVDDPVVAKKLYSAKAIIEPVVTTNEDKSTVREWVSKPPKEPSSVSESNPETDAKNTAHGVGDVEKDYVDKLWEETNEKTESNVYQCPQKTVQSVSSRWASLQGQPNPPQISKLEKTVRSAIKCPQTNQRQYWRPKSLEAWHDVSRRPSRRWSSHTCVHHSRRNIRDDCHEDLEKIVKTDKGERRHFRFSRIRGPVEQTRLGPNRHDTEGGTKSQSQMRKGDDEKEKRGMNLKLPRWLSRRKNKGQKKLEGVIQPDEEDETQAIETLPMPVETKIRVHVNPDETAFQLPVHKSRNDHHHIEEVDSVIKLMHDEMAVRKTGVLEEKELSDMSVQGRDDCGQERESKDTPVIYEGPLQEVSLGVKECQVDWKDEICATAVCAKEPTNSDHIFWFEGNEDLGLTRAKAVCGQLRDTNARRCLHPGYYLSQFYGENRTRFLFASNKPKTAGPVQTSTSFSPTLKPTNDLSSSAIPTVPTLTGSDLVSSQADYELNEFECGDYWERRRRRKALKNRLRVLSSVNDSFPAVITNNSSSGGLKSFQPLTFERIDSPASILRKRLDASPLRNEALCRSNEVALSDSIQVKLRPHFELSEANQVNSNKKQHTSRLQRESDVRLNVVPGSSSKTITDPSTGLVVSAQCDEVHIMMPKLAGKSLDRVLVEVEHSEATEKVMEDGQCVPVLSKELAGCEQSLQTALDEKTTNKATHVNQINQDEKPIVRNVCSLKRLSSHSLEDLILKGCESADRVLNDRLDEEIATLGVPKEECHELPVKDDKFVDRLVRRLKSRRNIDVTARCRSRPVTVHFDDFRFGNVTDRFQIDGRRHRLIQPVRTEPSHRFHFKESEVNLNENIRPRRLQRRHKEHRSIVDDTTVLDDRAENDHPKRSLRRRHQQSHQKPALAGTSSDSETKKRPLGRNVDCKPEEISGVISRSKHDGKMIETFMFNPLYAPSSRHRDTNVDSTGIISKLFPSLQADIERKSSVRIHSSLKLRTPGGRTYRLDSESPESFSTAQRFEDPTSKQSSKAPCVQPAALSHRPSRVGSPLGERKSLKEMVNKGIALKGSKCPSESSGYHCNELYTVFSEKIYFSNNRAKNVNTKPDDKSVHVETITISCPLFGKEERSELIAGGQFCVARKCKTGILSRLDGSVRDLRPPRRSRRRTKQQLDNVNQNVQCNAIDAEKNLHERHRRVKKAEGEVKQVA